VNAQDLHPSLAQLVARDARSIAANEVDAICAKGAHLLAIAEDPVRFRETLDLAVIAPELVRAFPGAFTLDLLLADEARIAASRFGVRRWPALVMLRDGQYVGAVEGLRNWDEYVTELRALLAASTRPVPAVAPMSMQAPDNG